MHSFSNVKFSMCHHPKCQTSGTSVARRPSTQGPVLRLCQPANPPLQPPTRPAPNLPPHAHAPPGQARGRCTTLWQGSSGVA